MTHGSLFSGIGGFDLAAQWMGWQNKFHCEWNEFGQKVLRHYWPKAELFTDITKSDFTKYHGTIDIISGGFPCQPYSMAGKRLGKEDDRHLWPEMLRVIREVRPRWVVGENVLGLVNWNGGLVFEEVQSDLEAEGYEVQPYVLPAAAVGAPHRRDRVWFVAYSNHARADIGLRTKREWSEKDNERKRQSFIECRKNGSNGDATDTNGIRLQQCKDSGEMGRGQGKMGRQGCEFTNAIEANGKVADAADPNLHGCNQRNGEHEKQQSERRVDAFRDIEPSHVDGDAIDTYCIGRDAIINDRGYVDVGQRKREFSATNSPQDWWRGFPTQSPVRKRDDGVSNKLANFVVNEFYDTDSNTSEENRIQDLQKVWERVQSQKVWEKIRRLYSLESKNVLYKTMQLYSNRTKPQINLSPFSEEFSKQFMPSLRKHKEFRCTPQGQELQKQRDREFGDSLPFLPHEVALAARSFESAIAKFENWHRNESIRAYGNAVVPQVVYQIFKAIETYEKLYNERGI